MLANGEKKKGIIKISVMKPITQSTPPGNETKRKGRIQDILS